MVVAEGKVGEGLVVYHLDMVCQLRPTWPNQLACPRQFGRRFAGGRVGVWAGGQTGSSARWLAL